MNIAVATVVHESEAQRQHVRVAMPGFVMVENAGERKRCRIVDISAGGVSFEPLAGITRGQVLRASLLFPMDPAMISLPVVLQVCSIGDGVAKIRCRFQGLGVAQVNIIRFFITSLLAGDLATTSEIMAVLGRENSSKARNEKEATTTGGSGPGRKLRAAAYTATVALMGTAAVAYSLYTAHDMLLVSHATAAKVTLPTTVVRVPRDATVYSLVRADGRVERGAPIASFETAANEPSSGPAALAGARSADPAVASVKGTLSSPCDCVVRRSYVGNGTVAAEGARLFDLSPLDAKPFVLARFDFDQASRISRGAAVRLSVAGLSGKVSGHVSDIDIGDAGELSGEALVTIVPDEPLPMKALDAPVQVSFGGYLPGPPWLDPRRWL